jgi:hypothetical protein
VVEERYLITTAVPISPVNGGFDERQPDPWARTRREEIARHASRGIVIAADTQQSISASYVRNPTAVQALIASCGR